MMEVFVVASSLTALIFSVVSFVYALKAFVEIKSDKKSTHAIQYVPVDDGRGPVDENGFEILTKKAKEKLENDDLDL